MNGITHRPAEISPAEARVAVQALEENGGNVSAAARSLGITRSKLHRRLRKADRWGISAHGEVIANSPRRLAPPEGGVARYILTTAQSNTKAHAILGNLEALAERYGAEIWIARIRYNHTAGQVGQEKVDRAADESVWYDSRVEKYLVDERVEICPGLIWAGDMNIIPTAVNPLTGLDSFTGADSCVFPHPQIAMKSVATAPETPAKFNYTTGAVTLKRYIQRTAGKKAEFHHSYGALLVEVDPSGAWFARQINATDSGVIYDLDVKVDGGKITTGNRVEVFTPGDIHGRRLDPVIQATVWGRGGLVDTLRPRHQVLHDVLDFASRSHHNNFFDLVAAHYGATESVEGEVKATAEALNSMIRPWCETVVAKGNHDEHLETWIMSADFRRDPINAEFYLTAAAAKVGAIRDKNTAFDLVEWVLVRAGLSPSIRFLSRRARLKIAGIRHDQHGDKGPNGARGSVVNIARTGEKSNIGHSHSAQITHGCYQAGTFSILDMGYNTGPSSWSQSAIVTYANGKRAVLTLRAGKWRA
jgi:transposase-like protein